MHKKLDKPTEEYLGSLNLCNDDHILKFLLFQFHKFHRHTSSITDYNDLNKIELNSKLNTQKMKPEDFVDIFHKYYLVLRHLRNQILLNFLN
jgi:hypothetical protein